MSTTPRAHGSIADRPINGPMSKFDYRATADRMLASLAASSPEYHALAAHTPTAPEWYYLYAALCACGPRGRAVVRVPSRLLEFGAHETRS